MIKEIERVKSLDGSSKYLFNDGKSEKGNFEALYFYPVDNVKKSSICMSTQIGCAVGCAFCATGKLGLSRNLKSSEMLEAITKILEDEKNDEEDISNFDTVALMGMGEPLHNYNEIKEFYHQAMDVLSVRHISLSTSGITDNIIKLAEDDTNYNLCFSLHSPFNDERRELMPINKRYPLEDVIKACEYYYYKKQKDALGLKIKASYLLLKDFNDSDRHIEELIKILNKDVFKVQILLYNENEKLPFKRPSIERAKYFEKKLNEHGLETKISISKGQDIAGACGQMAGKINLSK
ncbi:MAG: radical SAM protein [Clostridium sp.]|nr:radical SAM protein [Clostridium sp.]